MSAIVCGVHTCPRAAEDRTISDLKVWDGVPVCGYHRATLRAVMPETRFEGEVS